MSKRAELLLKGAFLLLIVVGAGLLAGSYHPTVSGSRWGSGTGPFAPWVEPPMFAFGIGCLALAFMVYPRRRSKE